MHSKNEPPTRMHGGVALHAYQRQVIVSIFSSLRRNRRMIEKMRDEEWETGTPTGQRKGDREDVMITQ